MKVNNIGYNYIAPQFAGKKNKNVENKNTIVVQVDNLPDNAKKALRTLLISALMASPAVMNTSCDGDVLTGVDTWTNPDPESYKDYMYLLPSREVDGINMPADTVNIKHGFVANEKLNNNLNTMLNTLNIPRYADGNMPVAISWLNREENGSKSLVRIKLNGEASEGGKYVYDAKEYSQDGLQRTYPCTASDDGDNIKFTINSDGTDRTLTLQKEGSDITLYENSNKKATYCESIFTNENGNSKHCVVKEAFDENGNTASLTAMTDFYLSSYSPATK